MTPHETAPRAAAAGRMSLSMEPTMRNMQALGRAAGRAGSAPRREATGMTPFDLVCSRLEPHGLRLFGDRGRAACPACGGRNKSTLSVGATNEGAVLLRCFKSECSVEAVAAALGLGVADLFPPRPAPGGGAPALKRRRLLSDRQALDLLDAEAGVVAIVAADIGQGREVSETDRQRVLQAAARVTLLREEARS
jgi:hypothetical protein